MLSANEEYNRLLDSMVDDFINFYPSIFAGEDYEHLIITDGFSISWNRDALSLFMRQGGLFSNEFQKFKKDVEVAILKWNKKDVSLLDSISWGEEVKKTIDIFKEMYLNINNKSD